MSSVITPDRLRSRLLTPSSRTPGPTTSIPCAVLVPLVPMEGGYGVVYTVRSEQLPSHKGQVAFPGGKHSAERDHDLLATALREAHEEIGIVPSEVDVLGRLAEVHTISADFVIAPYVGLLPRDYPYRANPDEVVDVFVVGVGDLADAAHHTRELREWRGGHYSIDVICAGRHKIWGATHRITMDLLERLGATPEPR